ncbi:MAG: hypothetical protein L0K86_17660, partial [Actinomycetia bacterium]|nr:hypothetical protein [Actinomycetes bacterium]
MKGISRLQTHLERLANEFPPRRGSTRPHGATLHAAHAALDDAVEREHAAGWCSSMLPPSF